jgi:DNA-binding MarR family transcriptional regulator
LIGSCNDLVYDPPVVVQSGMKSGTESGSASGTRLVELLIVLFDQFREHALTCMAEFDLSIPQAAALLRLDAPLSQRELADCLKYDASNITSIVDILERRGLVERQVDPSDRRVRRLTVTREGTRVLARLRECLLGQAKLVDGLDDDERARLEALLTKAVGDRTTSGWVEMFRGRP